MYPSTNFGGSFFEYFLSLCVGLEGFALLYADGLELVDHHLVPHEPRFILHHAVERLEKT